MNKNKGERSINKKIKRPKFIIFTDKDGTLNLDNKNLLFFKKEYMYE